MKQSNDNYVTNAGNIENFSNIRKFYVNDEVAKSIPDYYSTSDETDSTAVHRFVGVNDWEWYIIDGDFVNDGDCIFYGYVKGLEDEFGSFLFSDMLGNCGGAIWRDTDFVPTKLSVIRKSE